MVTVSDAVRPPLCSCATKEAALTFIWLNLKDINVKSALYCADAPVHERNASAGTVALSFGGIPLHIGLTSNPVIAQLCLSLSVFIRRPENLQSEHQCSRRGELGDVPVWKSTGRCARSFNGVACLPIWSLVYYFDAS